MDKLTRYRGVHAAWIGALLAAAVGLPGPSRADVIVMVDGTRLEGIVTTSSLMPDVVMFSDHVNEALRIPQRRIDRIVKEPESVSRLRMARALARDAKYARALEQVELAKRLAPTDPEILEEERTLMDALELQNARDAEKRAEETRGWLDRISEAMKKQEFDKAAPWFDLLAAERPTSDVLDQARDLRIRFYEAWGDNKLDRTDSFGAIECYEEVIAMDPENREVYTKLMRLHEKMYRPGSDSDATRTQRLQEFLEAKVEKDPTNLDARLRLANLLYMRQDWKGALEHYLAAYDETRTTGTTQLSLSRVEGRLASLLEMQHGELAKQNDYDAAIAAFEQLRSFFPDVDPEPLFRYEYMKKLQALEPGDIKGRLELVRYCETYGLESHARRELLNCLREDPKNGEALKIAQKWAMEDLGEIESAFQSGMYAQIEGLANRLQNEYPLDQFPGFETIHNAAQDYVERARNEARAVAREKGKRAIELAASGDENFERGMSALRAYREGAGTDYAPYRGSSRDYTTNVGSYKAEATTYLNRSVRYFREALALDPSLADPAKGDVKRKQADAQRYLAMLSSRRITRTAPPGRRSARRFKDPSRDYYVNPYGGYPFYPYVQPILPNQPGYYVPIPTPYGVNPYGNRVRP